jgi:serine kinase of HPr protein (carbohydrate metabolism regulator)
VSAAVTVHATALVVGETGVLLRGPSGAGKSAIALALLALAGDGRLFVRLVADDRAQLRVAHRRLVASPHPAIAGRIERRGQGIEAAAHLPAAVIGLVVDILPATEAPRLPEAGDLRVALLGVEAARIVVGPEPLAAAATILARLRSGGIAR